MENKISSVDERRLTNAIESAATLASNDASRDRNQLLADALMKEGVDTRFAKVASCAFNKRVTVLTFKKTADEHKADPFELTDGDKVLELMSGDSLEKAASVEVPFEIKVNDTAPTMQKAASAEAPARKPYEDTVHYDQLVQHIENVMTKQAAAIYNVLQNQRDAEKECNDLGRELADHFEKSASGTMEFTTLVNAYGDRFKNAIQDKLPKDTDWTPSAESAYLADTPINKKAARLVETYEASESLKQSLDKYGEGLTEFCKSAAALGNLIQKLELGLLKEAAGPIGPAIGEGAAEVGLTVPAALQGAVGAGDRFVGGIGNAAGTAIGNAYALYQAGNAAHMAPNEILDAEFLTNDRYRDRLLGWSDMTADPQFAMYPAEQVFLATQKAMDMDTTMERPDKREFLRAYVAQLLAQNNRVSTADVAALAQTLRGFTSADGHSAQQLGVQSAKAMDETRAPELPSLNSIISERVNIGDKERGSKIIDDIKELRKDYDARQSSKRDSEQRAKDAEDRANADKARQLANAQNARNDFLRQTMHIQIAPGAGGRLTYTQHGAPLNQRTVDAILRNAERANLVPALPV